MRRNFFLTALTALILGTTSLGAANVNLTNRSLIAMRYGANVYVSWRLLPTDDCKTTCFNVYRDNTLIASHLGNTTFFTDKQGNVNSTYRIETVVDGKITETNSVKPWNGYYKKYTFDRPDAGTIAETGEKYTYVVDGVMPADVDGDGNLEFIVRWDPTNKKDNSQKGYTGPVFIDCYKPADLQGAGNEVKRLWRIDMGRNIRAGAHYTQLLVHDFDGDGKAELILKTAPGTIDGTGKFVNEAADDATLKAIDNTEKDYNENGAIVKGAEMLTVFNGQTGAAVNTIYYNPNRNYSENSIATYPANAGTYWGDTYVNRSERYLAGVAYLDGKDKNPTAILSRGYYTIAYMWAVDYKNGKLIPRWRNYSRKYGQQYDVTTFNADGTETVKQKITAPANTFGKELYWPKDNKNVSGTNTIAGSGSHQLQIGDCDGDGKEEIVFGSATVDDNGYILYSTGLGHGDATHLGDLLPDRKGLEIFMAHEEAPYGWEIHDAATGEKIAYYTGKSDTGNGVAANFYPNYRGYEVFTSDVRNVYRANGDMILSADTCGEFGEMNTAVKHHILWGGTATEDFYFGNNIIRWNPQTLKRERVTSFNTKPYGYGVSLVKYDSKANPLFIGDILGDWREEVILLNDENKDTCSINIYSTTIPTEYRVPTLTSDHNYAMTLATQLVGYRMMPYLGYYLPDSIDKFATADETAETETINIGSTGYATHVSNHNLDFSNTQVKADIVTSADDKSGLVYLSQITKVPAHTPIIVQGGEGRHDIPVTDNAELDAENLLNYSTDGITPTENDDYTYYILSAIGNKVGFYPLQINTVIPAGKGYIKLPKGDGGSAKALLIADAATGIDNITAEDKSKDDAVYDLAGIRLYNNAVGRAQIVISKGKKYVRK